MPRSGPQTKSNELMHMTPTSVGAAISSGLLVGSAGNSQTTSMRISPDFSLPNNMLLSHSTGGGGGTLKKGADISKSFKVVAPSAMNSSSSQKIVNPTSISHSIREAVNKLLPP